MDSSSIGSDAYERVRVCVRVVYCTTYMYSDACMYARTCVCSRCAENNTHCTVTKPFVLVTKESGKFICIQRGLLMPHMCFSRMINISLAEKPREKRRVVCVYIKRSVSNGYCCCCCWHRCRSCSSHL